MSGAKVVSDVSEAAQELAGRVGRAKRVVFFGGAGVSTASGIPDFRSEDGLYHQKFKYPPEEMLSREFFLSHAEEFFDFYRTRMIALGAKPNQAHCKLAELERDGKLSAVVTQNIDGLHQAAGSRRVFELHGSVHRNVCQRCGRVYSAEWVMGTTGVPRCEECGGRIKPDVVLYGEPLDERTLVGAAEAIQSCDMLIVGGTSLVVYPAAGLVQYFQGDDLVIVNKQPTPQDGAASLVCACDIARAFDF
ncbi:MAG: NAD-dependent protein deacylase [Coriobacteriaceae bacterium]|uniref:NAD-dependent protein deacylase n=1 Tax=Tractidigestivibacter sp. TaxID=2847320 RepID=UPI002A90F76E|nr:NAD-dependent protein deacylase [Tractidigestivibacter sp.]MCI6548980.1 NAD-dependent protein deacylase [Coriobacteriaceae bacterium]MCI7439206.1 NAD-dependent protein deacylase [Coriobacteriaceae bacterium]MDY5270688.1 NAD-dependent protein deacylase [Tractidigestivibacter sp.]